MDPKQRERQKMIHNFEMWDTPHMFPHDPFEYQEYTDKMEHTEELTGEEDQYIMSGINGMPGVLMRQKSTTPGSEINNDSRDQIVLYRYGIDSDPHEEGSQDAEKVDREHEAQKLPKAIAATLQLQAITHPKWMTEFVVPGFMKGYGAKRGGAAPLTASSLSLLQQEIHSHDIRPAKENAQLACEYNPRDNLLFHGQQDYGGQVKTEIHSLTFLNWSPETKSDQSNAARICHLQGGGQPFLIHKYEVTIPKAQRPPIAGSDIPYMDRWIWFSVTGPICYIEPEGPHANAMPDELEGIKSTVTFAAPLTSTMMEHETMPMAKPTIIEEHKNIGVGRRRPEEVESWFENPAMFNPDHPQNPSTEANECTDEPDLRLWTSVPTQNFDFSRNGCPAMHFSTASMMRNTTDPSLLGLFASLGHDRDVEFCCAVVTQDDLHAQGSQPTNKGHESEHDATDGPDEENNESLAVSDSSETSEIADSETEEEAKLRVSSAIQKAVQRDIGVWAQIRRAMSTGCCRIIVREEMEYFRENQFVLAATNQHNRDKALNSISKGFGLKGLHASYGPKLGPKYPYLATEGALIDPTLILAPEWHDCSIIPPLMLERMARRNASNGVKTELDMTDWVDGEGGDENIDVEGEDEEKAKEEEHDEEDEDTSMADSLRDDDTGDALWLKWYDQSDPDTEMEPYSDDYTDSQMIEGGYVDSDRRGEAMSGRGCYGGNSRY